MIQEQKRKLRIAMVCDPISESKAGVVVSTLRFAKLLKERGNHIIFIGARSKEHKDHNDLYGIKAYRYRSIPLPKSGGWYMSFPTVGEIKKVLKEEKIDLIHTILPMSGAMVAILAARSLGIKIVSHSHSQPENIFMNTPRFIQPLLNNLWNKYLSWAYSKADLLVYPSEMARSLLSKLGKKKQSSVVISNGINLKEFKPEEVGDFYERFKIPKYKAKLVFVGRIFPEKSINTLIEAVPLIASKHENIHVMIVGGGYMRPKLENLARTLGVEKYVTFLGLVSERDKILSYNAADIFVLPSLAELEGMVVLEAMACGKPIIIADAEMSASRFFVDGNGFLFKKENPEDLAEKVLKLINDPNLLKNFGEASLEKVKNYDISQSVTKLEEAYYSVLKK